jgi:hypothetical protein
VRVERLADLILEPSDLLDKDLQGADQAGHDLAAGAGLDLTGPSGRRGPQPLEQLRRRFARVAECFEERGYPLFPQPTRVFRYPFSSWGQLR